MRESPRIPARGTACMLALSLAAAAGASGRTPASGREKKAAALPEVRRPAPLLPLRPSQDLELHPGETRLLEFQGMTQVSIGDPAVADVAPVSKRELLLMAKEIGETSLFVWDRAARHPYRVRVAKLEPPAPPKPDLDAISRSLREAIGSPGVRVFPLGEMIFLEGEVADAAQSQRAEALALALSPKVKNLIQVKAPLPPPAPVIAPPPPPSDDVAKTLNEALRPRGLTARALSPTLVLVEGTVPAADLEAVRKVIQAASGTVKVVDILQSPVPVKRQVVIRARIVDINRTRMKDLGVNWGQIDERVDGGIVKRRVVDQPFLFGLMNGGVQELQKFGARLDLLVNENAARILSEPNLLVMEGEKGNILVGGEFPIPVVQNTGGGAGGSVTIEYREYGIRLEVEPKSVGEKDLILKVAPEASILDYANAVSANGFVIPALRTRKEDSTVRIRLGETYAIGGLISNDQSQAVRRIPLLSKIPILGELFKSKSWLKNESELVILITPELVPEGEAPPNRGIGAQAPSLEIPRPKVPDSIRPNPKGEPAERAPGSSAPNRKGRQ